MKKILLALAIFLMLVMPAYAGDWTITSPMETGVTAFYNPGNGIVYGGINHTILRIKHAKVSWASLDLDGTLAQEINENGDTLVGIGIKANLNVLKTSETPGVSLLPSIGITPMTNFKSSQFPKDIISNTKVLIYGTVFMYKW